MGDNEEYIYARDGKGNIIRLFHTPQTEGKRSFAVGYDSHAEGYSSTANNHSSHAEGRQTVACGSNYESLSSALEQISKTAARCGVSFEQVAEAMRQSIAASFTPIDTAITSISKKLPQPELTKEKKEKIFELAKKLAEEQELEQAKEKGPDSFEFPTFDIDKYKIDFSEEAYSFDFEPHLPNLFDF